MGVKSSLTSDTYPYINFSQVGSHLYITIKIKILNDLIRIVKYLRREIVNSCLF